MKSIQLKQYGGAEQLEQVEVPKPAAGPKQVVVRILATSFNPFDPKRASGAMRQMFEIPFPFIPGGDLSGTIDSVGEGVTGFKVGDEVFGNTMRGGTYAEYLAVSVDEIAHKPKSVGHVEAASLAVVAQTAIQMVDRAIIKQGQTVLIHGAAGAVGGIAVQLAHQRGATVIATTSAAGRERVLSYGADRVIDYTTTPFETVVKNVDAVLDTVGGDTQQRSWGVLKSGGVLVAITQPPSQEEATKHHVTASFFSTESSSKTLAALAELIDEGKIKPFVGKVYPLSEAAQVWREYPNSHIQGKMVFTPGA